MKRETVVHSNGCEDVGGTVHRYVHLHVWFLILLLQVVPVGESRAADVGHWMTGAPVPTARTEVTAAVLDGLIYVIGGLESSTGWMMGRSSVSARVERYDPATDRWSEMQALPVGVHHAGAAVVDGDLYVVGGFAQSDETIWQPSNRVWRFHANRAVWEERAPLPTARGGLGVTTLQGNIIAVGGYNGQDNLAAVEVYDPGLDRWTSAAPLPTPRDHLAVVAVGETLYAIGGRVRLDYRANLSTVEAYQVATNQWVPLADLPKPRSGIAASVVDGQVYVFGGESGEGTFSDNDRYSPRENRWDAMVPMPTARHGLGAVAVEGHVYVVSGGPRPGGSYSALNEIFIPPVSSRPMQSGQSGRTPASHVGSVMAILAVMREAGVLPPESSVEASRLIHALIQYQSVFLSNPDPGLRAMLLAALAAKVGTKRAEVLTAGFASTGWTSETLEALVYTSDRRSVWEDPRWVEVLGGHGVTVHDWELIERMFNQARERLFAQGKNVHAVFAAQRAVMPGGLRTP